MGLYGVVILIACVRCPPAKRKKPFSPLFCFACLPVLSACPLLCVVSSWKRQQKKNGPFVGRFSLGGCVWFLLSELEHGKRCGLSAIYLYFVGLVVGFNPSGGGACDIIKIRFICCVRAALAVVYCYSLFHGVFSYRFKPLQTFSNIGSPPAI